MSLIECANTARTKSLRISLVILLGIALKILQWDSFIIYSQLFCYCCYFVHFVILLRHHWNHNLIRILILSLIRSFIVQFCGSNLVWELIVQYGILLAINRLWTCTLIVDTLQLYVRNIDQRIAILREKL